MVYCNMTDVPFFNKNEKSFKVEVFGCSVLSLLLYFSFLFYLLACLISHPGKASFTSDCHIGNCSGKSDNQSTVVPITFTYSLRFADCNNFLDIYSDTILSLVVYFSRRFLKEWSSKINLPRLNELNDSRIESWKFN